MSKFNIQDLIVALEGQSPDTVEPEERVIIALDFGTTYSGIAYCFPNQENSKVVAVVNWPGQSPKHLRRFDSRLLSAVG
jgi:molecular chaperone DnaK (HSP70)